MNAAAPEICPRAAENGIGRPGSPFKITGECNWREDRTCSYCGSFHPDDFMACLEAGTVVLTPTDKSYKVYVHLYAGEPERAPEGTHPDVARSIERTYPHGKPMGGPAGKFYFQHLSVDQRIRFIELLNQGRFKINSPGCFYVLPFFCVRTPG
jgi:hypothetical protein